MIYYEDLSGARSLRRARCFSWDLHARLFRARRQFDQTDELLWLPSQDDTFGVRILLNCNDSMLAGA